MSFTIKSMVEKDLKEGRTLSSIKNYIHDGIKLGFWNEDVTNEAREILREKRFILC